MTLYAFWSDGSEYATSLLDGLELLGVSTVMVGETDEIVAIESPELSGVLLVNPGPRLARECRAAMGKAGGQVSRTPLLAAMGSMEKLEDADTLRAVDDFVVSPGGAGEAVYRVRTVVCRRGGEGEAITCGGLVINLDAHQVFIEGRAVYLTYKEFELLRKLAGSPGRAFSREELLRGIWGYDYYGGTRTVDVHVRRLRAKIEGTRRYIETVHSVGYRFSAG